MAIENSRADALTYNQSYEDWFHDALSKGLVSAGSDKDMQRAWQAAILAASPVDQPAAAPKLAEKQRHAVDEAAKVLRDNWEHGTAEDLLMAFLPESSDPQPAAAPIARYMLDVNIDGVDQLREFVLASDYEQRVHDLETLCDPAGLTAENALLRDQTKMLDATIGRLKAELARPAPSPADERAAFEAWAKTKNMDLTPFDATFDSIFTSSAWDGWQARAASANETGAEGAKPCAEGRMPFNLTHEQVSALYLLLFRRVRPEFGWMEEPLVAIEAALKPAHDAIHDRGFNAMNRQFFGDDRMALDEARMPDQIAPAQADARVGLTDEEITEIGIESGLIIETRIECNAAWAGWQAARRTTPDREAIPVMIPPGYTLAPLEPDSAMLDRAVAFALNVKIGGDYRWTDYMRDLWARFLATAPSVSPAPAHALQSYCDAHCKKFCQNSVYGMCDGPPTSDKGGA